MIEIYDWATLIPDRSGGDLTEDKIKTLVDSYNWKNKASETVAPLPWGEVPETLIPSISRAFSMAAKRANGKLLGDKSAWVGKSHRTKENGEPQCFLAVSQLIEVEQTPCP